MISGRWKRIVGISVITVSSILLGPTALAQVSTATVNGTVRDASGAVVPNAQVTLQSSDTGVERSSLSNSSGVYGFVSVNPGTYVLRATSAGFDTEKTAAFTLNVGEASSIDFALKVGDQTTVTVTGSIPLLETSTSNVGTVIGTQQVNDLPLNGRNFTQLLQLTPGVSPVNVGQNAGGSFASGPIALGSAVTFPSVNGQTGRSNFFLTDGLNNYGTILDTYAVPPIIDAIQEFKIVSHSDSAEYGGVTGGVVNVVTKSGTSSLHGSAWEFARNTYFDAQPAFGSLADFSQHQFGGSIGGPIVIPKLYNGLEKTFFFGAYQGFRYKQTAGSGLIVPTAAELSGDFSDYRNGQGVVIPIYNPYSTRPDPSNPGQFLRDPFPGNKIPANLIDARLVALAQFIYPAAGTTNSQGFNAFDNTPTSQNQDEYTVRIDHTFNQKNFAWFRYSHIESTQVNSGGIPGLPFKLATPGSNYGGSYVHIFSPTLIVQGQYSHTIYQHNTTERFTKSTSGIISTVGFAPGFVGGYGATGDSLIPQIGIGGFAGGGEQIQNYPKATDGHEFRGTVTKILGKHDVHIGAGYTSLGFESPIAVAMLNFSSPQTADPENGATGIALASFLLNAPDNAERRDVYEKERPGGVFSIFGQDSWKASNKLTLNFGVRYDLTLFPPYGTSDTVGKHGGIETGDIDFTHGTYILQKLPPLCSQRGQSPCIPGAGLPDHVVVDSRGKIAYDNYDNVGPHIGFAYKAKDNLVVRGGFGIVFDNWAAATQISQNLEGGWPDTGSQLAQGLNNPQSGSITPNVTAQNPFSAGGGANLPAPTPFEQDGFYFDPHRKNPYSEQYNFGVAQQFSDTTTLTINYVGSVGKRLNVGGFYNTAPTPGPGNPRLRSPYPYIKPTFYDRSTGSADYNSLQATLERPFRRGLAYSVAYTWSKAIDTGSDGFFGIEGGVPQDPYHPAANGSRSVAGFDLINTLAVSLLAESPFGKQKAFSTGSRVADYVIGNWQLNNLFTAHSGLPFTVNISGDIANTGNNSFENPETANQIGDPNKIARRSSAAWFNTSAFTSPAPFTYGNTGRNSLRSQAFWDLDTSVFRLFPIRERYKAEFRVESFNTLNHTVFGTPVSNVSDANFGKIFGSASTARQLQFAAKFIF